MLNPRKTRKSKPKPEGDPHARALDAAYRLLSRREHSRRELTLKLAARGIDDSIIEPLLDRLIEEGALSDRRFAEGWVRSQVERGNGPLKILSGLRSKGVEWPLDECTEVPIDWVALAAQVRARRFGEARPQGRDDWHRQARFLGQRGFTHEQVLRVLGEDDPE